MKETPKEKKRRILRVIQRLRQVYPDARCALGFRTPWELLVATMLSAQCTDKRVNMVTPALFRKYSKIEDYANADLERFGEDIKSTGFYKNKARNIIGAAKEILERFGGKVPSRMEDLTGLPGVGRKTANVVLSTAYGIPGLTVDTHMIRLNNRLGFTKESDAVKIEFELMAFIPQRDWTHYSHLIIRHGRERCRARKPDCQGCEIRHLCPSAGKN